MDLKKLFPEKVGSEYSAKLLKLSLKELRKNFINRGYRILFKNNRQSKKLLSKDLDKIPERGKCPEKVIKEEINTFFDKIPNWRSPKNQYNICAPTNVASVVLSSLAQEYNIHNINSDFSGDCLMAERVISNMMANLAGVNKRRVKALFSFGGTASNLYAMKLALNKTIPEIGKNGIPENVYMLITEDAHFSHKTAADWLGIGTKKLIVVKSDDEGRSLIKDAERKLEEVLKIGGIVAGWNINGGPFYNFAIDDIKGFVNLRRRLIKKYDLKYVPHIHVDSVIGWVWLMFGDYDFKKNPLKIERGVLIPIKKQTKRIKQIKFADSWGVDFHKGGGGVPTPAGLFISNNSTDLVLLSKKFREICNTHHLGGYWSTEDPSDITLETSRSAGPALATIGSLLTLGKNGFRILLANQMRNTVYLRKKVATNSPFISASDNALGFNTMVVLAPKQIFENRKRNWENLKEIIETEDSKLEYLNQLIKSFYEYCLKHNPLGCSFSKSFYKTSKEKSLSGLKYCIVSPHVNKEIMNQEIKRLKTEFKKFMGEREKQTNG